MSTNTRLAYRTETGGETVSHLSRLSGDLEPERVARIHRPVTAKHGWRTKDDQTHPVTVRKVGDPR